MATTIVRVATAFSDADSFARNARERAFARLLRVRLWLAPGPATVALLFVWLDPQPWRRALLIAVVIGLLSLSVIEWVRFRRNGARELALPFNFVFMAVSHMCITYGTGGLFS